MFKLISYVVAYFFGSASKSLNLRGMAFEFLEEVVYRSRKTVALILAGFCSTILICGGLMMAILNASSQFDRVGYIYATATLWSGVGITVIFMGAAYYIFAIAWPGVHRHKNRAKTATHGQSQSTQKPTDLENAISLLVMDFIDSRKMRREERKHDRENKEARWETKHSKSPPPPSASGPH